MKAIHLRKLVVIAVLVVAPHRAMCQEAADNEDHSVVLQLGPAVERNLNNKTSGSGGTMAVEFTPIEDVLEIEIGTSVLSSSGGRELGGEIMFKKPYHLSPTSEIMIGIGPQVGRKYQDANAGTSFGVTFAFDLMFWPTKDIGWYINPEYGYGIGKSNGERSIGASIGIAFGL